MKYALTFALLGQVCAAQSLMASNWPARIVFGSTGVAFLGVGLAYGRTGPSTLFKTPSGTLSVLSYVVFWPYHLLNALGLTLFRSLGKENAFDQVSHNLYLGSQLNRQDSQRIIALGVCSVLDLTCEFSEAKPLRALPAYRCLPTLDTQAPTLEQLQSAIRWLEEQTAGGPAFVHCALGHGRSATIVAAYLLYKGGPPRSAKR
jgi:hypothetical protein